MMDEVEEWRQLIMKRNKDEAEKKAGEIFEKITKVRFKEENRGKWDIEILTVGNTPRPLILSILALKPENCVFICTEQSRETIDTVVRECGLKPSRIFIETIESKASGEDVYRAIQKYYTKEKKIAVDITGGTKAMVGGAASAASFLKLPIFYVMAQHEVINGKSWEVPNSEELVELRNPFEFFKSVEETIAMELLDAHAYSSATEILGKCSSHVREQTRIKYFDIKRHIAYGYLQWDNFNYSEAKKSLENALNAIKEFRIHMKGESISILDKQKNALKKLAEALNNRSLSDVLKDEDVAFSLIVDMFLNAERRKEQGQFGDGILRLYRTLEFITQFELVKYKIKPDEVSEDVREKYEKRFSEISKELYGAERKIPKELSLMDSAILLFCLKEDGKESVLWGPLTGSDDLKEFKQKLSPRNKAITVHGIKVPSEGDYDEMRKFVYPFIEKLVDKKLKDLVEILRHRKSNELFD